MKALRLISNQVLEVASINLADKIASGHVRVKVSFITLNHLDVFGYRGMAFARRNLPLTVGAEGAGTVVGLGEGVNENLLGKEVVVYSGYFCGNCVNCIKGRENLCTNGGGIVGFHRDGVAAEYIDVPARMVVIVPNNVALKHAVCAPVTFSTVCHMLFGNAELKRNETILVHAGGSGIGSTAIKLAKHVGAIVFTTVGSDEKAMRAKSLGADYVINYKTERFLREIRKNTDRRGVDVVFEHVGSDTWEESILSLALGGRLVTCGSTTGQEAKINLFSLFNQQLRIFGSFGAPISDVALSLELMSKGVLPEIDSVIPLSKFEEGINKLRERKVFGKIVISMDW